MESLFKLFFELSNPFLMFFLIKNPHLAVIRIFKQAIRSLVWQYRGQSKPGKRYSDRMRPSFNFNPYMQNVTCDTSPWTHHHHHRKWRWQHVVQIWPSICQTGKQALWWKDWLSKLMGNIRRKVLKASKGWSRSSPISRTAILTRTTMHIA